MQKILGDSEQGLKKKIQRNKVKKIPCVQCWIRSFSYITYIRLTNYLRNPGLKKYFITCKDLILPPKKGMKVSMK